MSDGDSVCAPSVDVTASWISSVVEAVGAMSTIDMPPDARLEDVIEHRRVEEVDTAEGASELRRLGDPDGRGTYELLGGAVSC